MLEKEGYVFKDENNKLYLVYCPKCKRENYGPAVSSGQCCWCGFKATEVTKNSSNVDLNRQK